MKDIPGYEGKYAITENGEIWSYPNKRNGFKGMWLKLYKAKTTYGRSTPRYHWNVSLFGKNGRKVQQAHRLVALTYIPNPNNLPIVNHKDGNPLNPCKANLEWVTNKDNSSHAYKKGLIRKPLLPGEVAEIRKLCQFYSCRKISIVYGFHPSTIWDIYSRRRYADIL